MRSYTQALRRAVTVFIFAGTLLTPLTGFCKEGVEWGRLRLIPKLGATTYYSDNIYLEHDNTTDDVYTVVSPQLELDIALAVHNYLALAYRGDFAFYSNADNFDTNNNYGEAAWRMKTAKGSTFDLGASYEDTSVQPFSPTDQAKKYKLPRFFADADMLVGSFSGIGLAYEHSARRFDSDFYADRDNYDRDQVDVSYRYLRLTRFPFLLQYRFVNQNNSNVGINTSYKTQTVFAGARWRPGERLSGALRVGYMWSDFTDPAVENFNGVAADTDITYRFSDFTSLTLSAVRDIRPSLVAERDTGNYYVNTAGGAAIRWHRFKYIITDVGYLYQRREYKGVNRTDNYQTAALTVRWVPRDWIALEVGYKYLDNSSDLSTVSYTENLVHVGLELSI